MHESNLISNLLKKIETIARDNHAKKIKKVTLSLGPFSPISAEHLREHFRFETLGSFAQGADLEIEEIRDEKSPLSSEILLKSVEVE